jgi:hypothetical protein
VEVAAAPALLRAPEAEEDVLVGEEERTDVVAVAEAACCKCIRDATSTTSLHGRARFDE